MSKDVDFYKRLLWFKARLFSSADPHDDGIAPVPAPEEKANLVSSLTDRGMHMPLIDIDYDAALLPSSTPGHFHLYLNKAVPWSKYKAVLVAMEEAGLIQKGYLNWSVERGMSMLRRPGVLKPPYEPKGEKVPTIPRPVTKEDYETLNAILEAMNMSPVLPAGKTDSTTEKDSEESPSSDATSVTP